MNSNSFAPQRDFDLIRRAQQGEPDAFADLFNAHKGKVYSLCLRMTNNAAEAEDLTQDAFLQVFRKLATFRGDSALSTWLYRIAVNTVLMHFRKKSLCLFSLDEPCSNGLDAKPVRREFGTRDNHLAGCVDRVTLNRAIKELPNGYRTIFLLHEVEGYEHHEIGELLGCSAGNSKSQLHKAKLRIRELLMDNQSKQTEVPEREPARARCRKAVNVRFAEKDLSEERDIPLPPRPMVPAMSQFAETNG